MCVQSILLWTHGKKILSRKAFFEWKKIVLNINMVSIGISVVLFFTRIRLSEIIGDTFQSVGNMIGPASKVVTGMLFAGMDVNYKF